MHVGRHTKRHPHELTAQQKLAQYRAREHNIIPAWIRSLFGQHIQDNLPPDAYRIPGRLHRPQCGYQLREPKGGIPKEKIKPPVEIPPEIKALGKHRTLVSGKLLPLTKSMYRYDRALTMKRKKMRLPSVPEEQAEDVMAT